ncbi:hypothetical protein Tco_1061661, partial [Tanacetum coccineum]
MQGLFIMEGSDLQAHPFQITSLAGGASEHPFADYVPVQRRDDEEVPVGNPIDYLQMVEMTEMKRWTSRGRSIWTFDADEELRRMRWIVELLPRSVEEHERLRLHVLILRLPDADSEVARLLAISSPPASPLSPCPIRMRDEAAATSHSLPLPPPFILSPTRPDAPPPLPTSTPTSLPPLLLPSASRREDIPEVNLPPRRRLGITLGPRYEVGESSAAAAARPAGGLRADYVTQRDMLDMGLRIRGMRLLRPYRELQEAWGRSMDASDLARAEVMSLRTTVHAQMTEITELQSADRSRRREISDLLETNYGRREEMRELRAVDHTR